MIEAGSHSSFPALVPTRMVEGFGAFNKLPFVVQDYGKRPFIVTGATSARAMGLIDRISEWFPQGVVFDRVPENPTAALCDEAAALARVNGCDVIVAIGGGSPMDVAKAVAGLTLNPGACHEFFGSDTFPRGCMPVIAAPTTAGSGSEVTPYAVIVDDASHSKRTIGGKALFPAVAILDPHLTLTLPRSITVATGLDALSQAMEGMVSKKAVADHAPYALEAIRLVRRYLPVAADRPDDRPAREAMMRAAALSGMIIAHSGTTLVHGMGYPLTLDCGIAHGLANALLLGPLFRFNAEEQPETVGAIAEALGAPADAPLDEAVVQALHSLLVALRVSPAARDHGFRDNQITPFAAGIAADPYRYRNQFGTITEERIAQFYQEAYVGD